MLLEGRDLGWKPLDYRRLSQRQGNTQSSGLQTLRKHGGCPPTCDLGNSTTWTPVPTYWSLFKQHKLKNKGKETCAKSRRADRYLDPLSFHTFYRTLRDRTDKESNPLSGARNPTWPRGTKVITEMEGSIHSEHWELGWDKGASHHHLCRARALGSSGIRAWNAHHAQSK